MGTAQDSIDLDATSKFSNEYSSMKYAQAGPSFQINREEQERLKIISCFFDHFSQWLKFWGLAFILRKLVLGEKPFFFDLDVLGLH